MPSENPIQFHDRYKCHSHLFPLKLQWSKFNDTSPPLHILHPLHIFPSVVTATAFAVSETVTYCCMLLIMYIFTESTKYGVIAPLTLK